MFKNAANKLTLCLLASAFLLGCGNKPDFGLQADLNSFAQVPETVVGKIDILFVVDNSGSMQSSQSNLTNNMQTFIETFQKKGMDFRMAVIGTDAWRTSFGDPASLAQFRDGAGANHTGVYVIEPTTPNLTQTFMTNLLLGTQGGADERAFQSIKTALTHNVNSAFGFPRKDAFLSIILLSDEDDFSNNTNSLRETYVSPDLHPVQSYVDFLDEFTDSIGRPRQYNVNTIAILDQACLDTFANQGLKIGIRYKEMSAATNGITASICDNFSTSLSSISNKIIQLSTKFYLNRKPHPDSIRVTVNGVSIPNSAVNGWVYNADDNSVSFPGSFTPPAGASIDVKFNPSTLL